MFQSIVLVLFTGLVFIDQIWVVYPYDQEKLITDFASDRDFVREIEMQMPDNAMIFQLPFMEYPEAGNIRDLLDYDHFKVYLHSNGIRWSYGAMKGRESSEWNRFASSLPIEEMVKALSAANYSGIQIDRNGYTKTEWKDLENTLSNILRVKPIISQNDRLVFFDPTAL